MTFATLRQPPGSPARSLSIDNRGLSPLLGIILIITIVTVASVSALYVGFSEIGVFQSQAEVESTVDSFSVMDAKIS